MTLFQIIQILKEIALAQPNIKSATDGSIYDIMNTNPSVKYDVVHFSQTTHQSDEETDYYGLNIFYVSRLEDSLEDNRLQIQSIGKEILDNIIRTFCENWGIDFPVITYTPFTQKFNDLCAGCYCNLRLEIPKEIICADDYVAEVVPGSGIKLQDIGITITQNGLIVITPDAEYDGIGEIRIETNVPQYPAVLQDKEVEYTENGSYTVRPDSNYDGLSSVSVDVLVPDRYDEGYDDGKEDGIEEQKGKLVITSFTENDTYTRVDGWSAVTVNVPQGQGYDEGYADGEAAQAAKLSSTSFTENSAYTRADGWSSVTVNVDTASTYNSGYTDGEEAQKAKLSSTSFTQNDSYTLQDGWSSVTVNVDDRYDEGYADGYRDGTSVCSGLFITSLTINVESAITNAGLATTSFSPVTAYTDIYYTSSDPTIATIDPDTGVINVVTDGIVTFCSIDKLSGLRDCKNVVVSLGEVDATAITLNTPETVVGIGQATVTVEPMGATVDIEFSSSDESIATIDELGTIVAVSDGVVTICATDRITQLTDCKVVNIITSVNYKEYLTVVYTAATTDPIKIIEAQYGYDTIDYFFYNGGKYNLTSDFSTFAFPTTGRQVCSYHLRTATTVGANAFSGCSNILEVRVPAGVTTVENSCFNGCTSLTSVTMPSEIQALGELSFANCSSFRYMLLRATTPPSTYLGGANGTFLNTIYSGHTGEFYVPSGSTRAYINSNFGMQPGTYPGSRVIPFNPSYITGTTKIVEVIYTTSASSQYVQLWRGNSYIAQSNTTIPTGWTEMYEFKDSIEALEIDGVLVAVDCFYRFASTGRHTVKIYITTDRMPGDCFSYNTNNFYNELTEIKIGKGILYLDMMMVYAAGNLTSVTIENTVGQVYMTWPTSIGMAFRYANIREMTFLGTTVPVYGPGVENYDVEIERIYVPASALNNYKSSWPTYASRITAIP